MSLSPLFVEDIVRQALKEDLGHGYDLTSQFVVDGAADATAAIRAREDGVVAGLAPALTAFALTDPDISCSIEKVDGQDVQAGDTIAVVSGPAQAILTAERVALNFLNYLSGIASLTAQFVDMVEGTDARIVSTRKTMPNLRGLQLDAVRSGGGYNHRFGLDNGILIKDNHIALAGSIKDALEAARNKSGHMVKIQIELETPEQVGEAFETGLADAILLDNMTPDQIGECMKLLDDIMVVEASGGVVPETVREIAETGVHYVSIGALTHSARSLDIGLDIEK